MLRKLELTNFRQHQDLVLEFGPGITVIRGANECGKSTIFEAIIFALFGVDACRSGDLSTWGAPEKSHKVKLELNLNGQNIFIERSARSAELNFNDVKVTGQREVTKRCEQLLDLKPGTGTNLMFVSQGGVRGTLDEGSKSIQLIEQLANFDAIENFIKVLQTEYCLGKYDHLELAIKNIEDNMEQVKSELDSQPDPDELARTEKEELSLSLQQAETKEAELNVRITYIQQQLESTKSIEFNRTQLESAIATTQKNINYLTYKLQESPNNVSVENIPALLTELTANLNLLQKEKERQKQLADLKSDFDSYPEQYESVIRVGGTAESVKAEFEELCSERDETLNLKGTLEAEIRSLSSQLQTNLACPTCKREWANAEELRRVNEETQTKLAERRVQLDQLQQEIAGLTHRTGTLKQILTQNIFTPSLESKWKPVDDGKYPPVYVWTGGELEAPDPEINTKLRSCEQSIEQLRAWDVQQQNLNTQLADAKQQLNDLQGQLHRLPPLQQTSQELNNLLSTVNVELNTVQHTRNYVLTELEKLPAKTEELKNKIAEQTKQIEKFKLQIKNNKVQIKDIKTNNQLLKLLRTIKPELANVIWQQVCTTISNYFSVMRDTPSVITRDSGGFRVDGHNTKALSGSTLDILGVAIRVALTKTFLPMANFLMLDEPFAACDEERQMKMLGFIASAGFEQVIVVTHESTTEAIADTLITL